MASRNSLSTWVFFHEISHLLVMTSYCVHLLHFQKYNNESSVSEPYGWQAAGSLMRFEDSVIILSMHMQLHFGVHKI